MVLRLEISNRIAVVLKWELKPALMTPGAPAVFSGGVGAISRSSVKPTAWSGILVFGTDINNKKNAAG